MAPAQLSRLRPQITALSSLFEHPSAYIKSLENLLEKYQSDIDISSSRIESYSLIKRMNIPEIVISQLDISFNHLVRSYPEKAIEIAEAIWKNEHFEYKQIAFLLLSKLPINKVHVFFDSVDQWITHETETPVFHSLLETIRLNQSLSQNDRWIDKITSWAISDNIRLRKFGLIGFIDFIQAGKQYPPPELIKKFKVVFSNPNIKTNTETLELIKILASYSSNETAALLISLGINNPKPEVKKFIRKCLHLFPQSLAERIKNVSQI